MTVRPGRLPARAFRTDGDRHGTQRPIPRRDSGRVIRLLPSRNGAVRGCLLGGFSSGLSCWIQGVRDWRSISIGGRTGGEQSADWPGSRARFGACTCPARRDRYAAVLRTGRYNDQARRPVPTAVTHAEGRPKVADCPAAFQAA